MKRENKIASPGVQSFFTINELLSMITEIPQANASSLELPMFDMWKVIRLCTAYAEFVLKGMYHKQTNDVAMRNPMCQVLADIFMGYLEPVYVISIQAVR